MNGKDNGPSEFHNLTVYSLFLSHKTLSIYHPFGFMVAFCNHLRNPNFLHVVFMFLYLRCLNTYHPYKEGQVFLSYHKTLKDSQQPDSALHPVIISISLYTIAAQSR